MKLTGKTGKQIDKTPAKEGKKEAIKQTDSFQTDDELKKAALTLDELEKVSGGGSAMNISLFRRI